MSEEREVLRVVPEGATKTEEELKEEFKPIESKVERKARIARVLERGITGDRLNVELPPHLRGEWVSVDPIAIDRAKSIGFYIDPEFGAKRGIHGDGTDRPIVGDVVFMVIAREDHDLIEEVQQERYNAMHGRKGDEKRKQAEELAFKAKVEQSLGMPAIEESAAREARKEQIDAALRGEQ